MLKIFLLASGNKDPVLIRLYPLSWTDEFVQGCPGVMIPFVGIKRGD